MEKQPLTFENYGMKHIEELNTWQKLEKMQGEDGLDTFVVAGGVLLGDFLTYISHEMGISTKIALDGENIVGFVCYEVKEDSSAHIEVMGTSPKFRRRGYSKRMLIDIKDQLIREHDIDRVTFAVKNTNEAGLNSFAKVAQECQKLDHGEYKGFEIK